MKKALVSLIFLLTSSMVITAQADNIIRTGSGQEMVEISDVIVVQPTGQIKYYYCEDGVVQYDYLMDKDGDISYRVEESTPEKRVAIVEGWKKTGFTTLLKHKGGHRVQLDNAHIHVLPPKGYVFAFSANTDFEFTRKYLNVEDSDGSFRKVPFRDIKRVSIKKKELKILLISGRELSARLNFDLVDNKPVRFQVVGVRHYNKSKNQVDFWEKDIERINSFEIIREQPAK